MPPPSCPGETPLRPLQGTCSNVLASFPLEEAESHSASPFAPEIAGSGSGVLAGKSTLAK